jgi:predicted DCC family thiol-disulfide oxidoreductase YuxK
MMDFHLYPLELLYDGECPICRFDMAKLRQADRYGRLIFTDITEPGFDPEPYGATLEQLLAKMHARRHDGEMVEGAEVMRLALNAVGLAWLVAPIRWPLFDCITEMSYRWFANNRIRLARRYGSFFNRLTPECGQACCSPKKV